MLKNRKMATVIKGAFIGISTLIMSSCGEDVNENFGESNIESTVEGDYTIDVESSTVIWVAGEMIGSGHQGTVRIKEGLLIFKDSVLTGGEIVMDMNTIVCTDEESEKLLNKLKGEEFFNVVEFPTAKFVIKEGKDVDGDFIVSGDLTIMKWTNTLEMKVDITADAEQASANTTFTFDRTKWGVVYNSQSVLGDVGDNFILDEVELQVTLVADK